MFNLRQGRGNDITSPPDADRDWTYQFLHVGLQHFKSSDLTNCLMQIPEVRPCSCTHSNQSAEPVGCPWKCHLPYSKISRHWLYGQSPQCGGVTVRESQREFNDLSGAKLTGGWGGQGADTRKKGSQIQWGWDEQADRRWTGCRVKKETRDVS